MGKEGSSILCPKCFTFSIEESDFCNKCGALLEEKQDTLSVDSDEIILEDKIVFSSGENFGKRYRLIEELGRGGMGRVYRAEDLELNITVALKIIRPRYSSNPLFIQNFKKEMLAARSIAHENVVRIYDLGEQDNIKYFSMEFIKGQNLRDLIRVSGAFTKKRVVEITRQICYALKAARNHGIVHCDLKPSNIMIDNNGQAHVMDFGLAKSISGLEPEKPKYIAGSPPYMSPEQVNRDKLDHRADIYSLGLIIHEMLVGEPAFDADTKDEYFRKQVSETPPLPSQINPEIPPFFDNIVSKCLAKNKEERYASADEILKEITAAEEAQIPISALSRLKRFLPYIAAAAFVVFAGVTFLILNKQGAPSASTLVDIRVPVAVVYFENNTGEKALDDLSNMFTNLVILDLMQSKYVRPLTPDQTVQIHRELNLTGAENYSTEDLRRIAERGEAAYVLWGNYHTVDDTLQVNTFVYRVDPWSMTATRSAEGAQDEWAPIVDNLTVKIKNALDLPEAKIADDIDRKVSDFTTDSPLALNHYFQAIKLYDERKFAESNVSLLQAVEIDPGFAMAYRKISINYDYLRDTKNATLYLAKALNYLDEVSDREKYLILGYNAQMSGNSMTEAAGHYEALLGIYPDDIDGNIQLGSLYRNQEEWDKALFRFDRVVRADKNNMLANYNTAIIFKAQGLYNRALEHLENHQNVFASQTVYYREMSRLFFHQGQLDLALEEVKNIHAIEPDSSDYHFQKGNIHHVRNEFEEAGSEYEKLIQHEADSVQLRGHAWSARLYLTQGLLEKALKETLDGLDLSRECGLQPYETEFLLFESYLMLLKKDFARAKKTAEQAFELATQIFERDDARMALLFQGMGALENDEMDSAETLAMQLKDLIESTGFENFLRMYHYLMGQISQKKGDISHAVNYFEIAWNSLPHQRSSSDNHALYLFALANAEEEKGDLLKAHAHYEQFESLTTGKIRWGDLYVRSLYRRGALCQQRGMKDDAIECYEKFLTLWENEVDLGHAERQYAGEQLKLLKAKNPSQ